jgi:hypothetical protein
MNEHEMNHYIGRFVGLGVIAFLLLVGLAFTFWAVYSPRPF